jgi:hypothetical protein
MKPTVAVQRQIPCDLPEEQAQIGRPLRRNGIPRTKPCIVDAFLGIMRTFENAVSDRLTVDMIFFVGVLDRTFVAALVQIKDLRILQSSHPLGVSYNKTQFSAESDRIFRIYFILSFHASSVKKIR